MSPQKKKEEKPVEKLENIKTSTSRTSKNVSARSKKTTPTKAAAQVKTEAIKKTEIKAKSESKQENLKQQAISISDRGPFILGAGMLVMGVLLLAGRLLSIPFGQFLWPFIFIVPGAMVFFSALNTDKDGGEGLAILGGILGMLGLVFLMQVITGLWASWAYIWALIAPTSIGLSQMAYGNMKNRESISATGWKLTKIGLSIFIVGFIFFEVIIGISGFGLGNFGIPIFPVVLIFIGGFIVIRTILNSK